MIISRKMLANKLKSYLNNSLTKEDLIVWCENAMQDNFFENENVQQVVARIGLMDTTNFEVSYEDLAEMLNKIGFKLKVDVI